MREKGYIGACPFKLQKLLHLYLKFVPTLIRVGHRRNDDPTIVYINSDDSITETYNCTNTCSNEKSIEVKGREENEIELKLRTFGFLHFVL